MRYVAQLGGLRGLFSQLSPGYMTSPSPEIDTRHSTLLEASGTTLLTAFNNK